MTEETKELINCIRVNLRHNKCFGGIDEIECKLLLDCITNLQQEINKLTAESTEWESKYYDLQQENKELKEDKEFIDMTHRNTKLLGQQEEFINYMMNTIENITHDETDDEEIKGYLIQRGNTFKEILSKYKEIRGNDINVGSMGGKDER